MTKKGCQQVGHIGCQVGSFKSKIMHMPQFHS